MVEDDEGHARLIEKNIRRAGVNNEIMPFTNGTDAVRYLFGSDGTRRGQQGPCAADPARPQPAGHDRRRHPQARQGKRAPQALAGRRADDHRRPAGNPALLRSRLQRLRHQAGQLRELRQRHPAARPVLLRHPGAARPPEMRNPVHPRPLYRRRSPACAGWSRRGWSASAAPSKPPTSGEDGLARLAEGGIDAVGLDQNMPGLDGLQTLERISALPDPPPVIFVTAEQDSRVAISALKAGAFDYVIKDIQGEFLPLLSAAIQTALDASRLRRAKEAAEAEVREARDRFEALAAERALLMREVNHRVGNSLQLIASMLKLQASNADSAGCARGDDHRHRPRAGGRAGSQAALHVRRCAIGGARPISDRAGRGPAPLLDRRRHVAAHAVRRSGRDRSGPRGGDRRGRQRTGAQCGEIRLSARARARSGSSSTTGPPQDRAVASRTTASAAAEGAAPQSTGLGQRIVTAMAQKLDAELSNDPRTQGHPRRAELRPQSAGSRSD